MVSAVEQRQDTPGKTTSIEEHTLNTRDLGELEAAGETFFDSFCKFPGVSIE